MDRIYFILGGRPNYVKAWQVIKEMEKHCECKIVDLSQHSHKDMSFEMARSFGLVKHHTIDLTSFHKQYGINYSDRFNYGVNKLLHYLKEDSRNLKCFTFVFGDMDAALIGALASFKCGIRIVHVEAGLRSLSPTQKEERNRIMIDRLSSIHFCTEDSAMVNLDRESHTNCYLVGNTMIDSLVSHKKEGELSSKAILTLHRPENVDDPFRLIFLLSKIRDMGFVDLDFYMHPRTIDILERNNCMDFVHSLNFLNLYDPLPYSKFIEKLSQCEYVVTDSGGIQEEIAFMKKRCYTLRESTERPSTVYCKSNIIIDPSLLFKDSVIINGVPNYDFMESIGRNLNEEIQDIPYWDGKASQRIAKIMIDIKNGL